MLLKSLRVRGFKSFADTTDFVLTPGITCVVGPNGSGKSNIVDALVWVMGAQAARQLRGGKMEDVIFMGTPQRQALGRAEVELVIDNSSGAIPVDVPELAIGRLLFRNGDSRYAINGEPARLVDVVELLSDAGVGRQMHNIVGQGRIDAILQSQPEERRVAIEEAAGVLKHRKRREKALRRLEAVEADLVRLEDVHAELLRRLRPLERQVKGAQRYEELSGELTALSRWRAGEEIRRRRAQAATAAAAARDAAAEVAALVARVEACASEVAALEASGRDGAEGVERARSAREALDRVSGRFHALAQVANERRRAAESQLRRLSGGNDAAIDFAAERDRVQGELAELADTATALDEQAQRVEVDALDCDAALHELDAAWRAAGLDGDDRRAALESQRASAGSAAERAAADVARLGARRDGVATRLAEVTDALAALDAESASSGTEAEAADDVRARREALSAERQELQAKLRSLTDEHRTLTSQAAAQNARADSLDAAAAEGKGAEKAAAALAGRFGRLPRLRELLVIESGAEAAVAAALGRLLNAVVLPEQTAAGAVDVVKGVEEGALVLGVAVDAPDGPDPRERAAELGCLSLLEVVRAADGEQQTLVDALVRANVAMTFLCRNAAHALALSADHPDAAFVTSDGDRFGAGVLAVRSPKRRQAVDPAIAAVEARRTAAAVAAAAADIEPQLAPLQDRLAALRETDEALARELATADAARKARKAERDRLDRERGGLAREAAQLDAQLAKAESAQRDAQGRRDELAQRLADAAPTATDAERGELEQRRRELEATSSALRKESLSVEGERARCGERRRALTARLGDLDRRESESVQRAQRTAAETARHEATLQALTAIDEVIGAASVEVSRRRADAAAKLEERQRARKGTLERLEAARKDQTEATKTHARAVDASRGTELAEAEARMRLEAAEDVPRRELRVALDVALFATLPEGIDPAEVDDRIETLERQLRRLGPVNPLAVQEFAELSERKETLDRELGDVKSAKREIVNVVTEVDDRIREVLTQAYADVSRHFSDLFALLFPGGEGRMILTEPDDVLGTGVDIEARPSGKSPKRLSLLSGGERSLTALAFLFAIFRARPSPFYVLDEVEAALDDINLHRFCNLLREFRRDSQLIVVTHQKRTMETADVLYGVSLRSDGSSQVLSQKMADIDVTDSPLATDPVPAATGAIVPDATDGTD